MIREFSEESVKNKFNVERISKELLRCLRVFESGKVPKYRGYDITSCELLATTFNLKERFNKEFLDRFEGDELIERIIGAALNLGMDFGIRLEEEKRDTLNHIIEIQESIIKSHDKRN